MKKTIRVSLWILFLLIVIPDLLCACGTGTAEPPDTAEPDQPYGIRYDDRQWIADELQFQSDREYDAPVYSVTMDCVFTNESTGTTYTVPAFWNGGCDWIVRYALTETGTWTWKTTCSDPDNAGLDGREGTLICGPYEGELAIYRHGFIKTEEGKHYFMYADGTPFFYLGDTHWSLPMEDYDGYGDITEEQAAEYGVTSMFRYNIDYRASQGFTVIQSEPLSEYEGVTGNSWFGDKDGDIYTYGVNAAMLEKFQEYDKKFRYIAEKGLVHVNAELSYPEELIEEWLSENRILTEEHLEALCRYWVARYSAYPVMWATVQEGDNDYNHYGGCTPENNPWVKVFEFTQKYDPYDHPASCHQEHVAIFPIEDSVFADLDGYTWYAMQYSTDTGANQNQAFESLRRYYIRPGSKPTVLYEGAYDHFWIGPNGARAQGWCAYLNGVFGYGYGIQPIWELYWASRDADPYSAFGEDFDRDMNWYEGLTSSGGDSMQYMRRFFEEYRWWELVPCFDGNDYYTPAASSVKIASNYSFATIGNDLYIGYLYYPRKLPDGMFGKMTGMKEGEYEVRWYNPRTGEYAEGKEYEKYNKTISVSDGEMIVPNKPDKEDWVIVVRYIG